MLESTASVFDQRDLFGPTAETLEDRFLEFHDANPDVYTEIVELARRAKAGGRRHWSINGVFEVLRYSRLQTQGEQFKLNNSFRAAYARMVMDRNPDLMGFFEVRDRSAA